MPDDQVVQHVVRRDVDQVGPLVEDARSSSPWAGCSAVSISSIFSCDRLGGRQRLLVLPHQDDALDDVVLAVAADDPQPRPVADDHLGDLPDVDRHAVVAW